MVRRGQIVSSSNETFAKNIRHEILTAHFRVQNNNTTVLNGLRNLQVYFASQNVSVSQKICIKNDKPMVYLKTSISPKPIRLLVDTGASVSLIADDLITKCEQVHDFHITIFGIVGEAAPIAVVFVTAKLSVCLHIVLSQNNLF